MDQMSRMATLDAFREGRITLLAASDVAARGLDIPDVSHIFNFDVPWQADDYVHRIGRTGRAGKEGRSLTIVTGEDIKQLKDIEKMLGAPVTWIGEPPSEDDIAAGIGRKRGRRGAAGRAAGGRRSGAGRDAKRERPQDAAPRSARGRTPRPERAAQANGNGARDAAANGARPHGEERAPREPKLPARGPASGKPQRPRRERKPPRQPWEPREPRPRDRDDRVPTPVGLGDHVPAFLRKPVRSGH
jgi:superfamily II DNA/RNA helicase